MPNFHFLKKKNIPSIKNIQVKNLSIERLWLNILASAALSSIILATFATSLFFKVLNEDLFAKSAENGSKPSVLINKDRLIDVIGKINSRSN